MQYQLTINGISPLIMHSGAALDPRLPLNIEKAEIASKRGSNRTEADDMRLRQIETVLSLWIGPEDTPEIPAAAMRSSIETGARKLRQGPMVREGLIVERCTGFEYDPALGSTVEELASSAQFTVPVVVQRSRILRTRAKFDTWSASFDIDTDEELVDEAKLRQWLDISGRRIGLGDWRPEKSGHYGRFEVAELKALK